MKVTSDMCDQDPEQAFSFILLQQPLSKCSYRIQSPQLIPSALLLLLLWLGIFLQYGGLLYFLSCVQVKVNFSGQFSCLKTKKFDLYMSIYMVVHYLLILCFINLTDKGHWLWKNLGFCHPSC